GRLGLLTACQFRAFHFLGLLSAVAADRGCLLCCAPEASGERSFSCDRPERSQAMGRRTEREHVDWLRRRTRAMCVTAPAGGRAPHETQGIFNYFGANARNRGTTTGYSCRSQGTLAGALLHRTAAAHQPRFAGARPSLSHPGKGARRA